MDLCTSFLTLSGATVKSSGTTMAQTPARGPHVRARAAYRAGFTGMGLADADLTTGTALASLASLAVPVRELEWFDLSRPDYSALDRLMSVARVTGTVQRLHCGSAFPVTGCEIQALQRASTACQRAGILCAVEPVAFGGVRTLEGIQDLISSAGSPAGTGVLYDTWHVYRAYRKLPVIPASQIAAVQISGTRAHWRASVLTDAMDRTWPTAGIDAEDISVFLAAIRAGAYTGPIAIEMPNARMRAIGLPVQMLARDAYDSAADIMDGVL